MSEPTVVAMGGGGFSMEPHNLALDQFILGLVGKERPKVCNLPTASGDDPVYVQRFMQAFATLPCEPTHLSLFRREVQDLRRFVLEQDVIYVGGGNTFNMLTLWRAHGLDEVLREAWQQGVIMCGLSAGSLCWYEAGVTDSFGPLKELCDGLGFIEGSHCPHYDGEAQRRPTYEALVRSGTLPGGIAADDGVALVYRGAELVEVVSSRPGTQAWRVESLKGELQVEALTPRLLSPGPFVCESWPER